MDRLVRFKHLDLNLLVVLDVLLREHGVSRAAERLNLSQPAMSAALGRLRSYFNDDILVSHGKRMIPTAHAQGLAPLVRKALADIEELISVSAVFDPAASRRTFRIAASDYVTTVLLVPLLERLAVCAPNLRVDIASPSRQTTEQLDRGEIDFVLAPEQYLAPEHPTRLLLEERFVVVGWKGNPAFRRPLTEEAFFAHGHIAVAMGDTSTFAELTLALLGRKRSIEVTAPSFLTVPWMLPNTLRLSVMHERLAKVMVKRLPLAMAPMPFGFPVMREMVQHHGARGTDGGVQWLLQQIEAGAALERRGIQEMNGSS